MRVPQPKARPNVTKSARGSNGPKLGNLLRGEVEAVILVLRLGAELKEVDYFVV